MIDLSKNIEDLSIASDEDFEQSINLVEQNKVVEFVDSQDPKYKESNLKFKKIQKLIQEINRYHTHIIMARNVDTSKKMENIRNGYY